MTDEAPLSGNEKALTISVLVIGGLIALMGLYVVTGAVYTLQTGKVFGGGFSRAMMSLSKDKRAQEAVEKQLTAQAEVQKKYALPQLGSEAAYLGAWGVMMFAGIAMLQGKPGRRRMANAALFGIAARLVVGIVTWLLTSELTQAATANVLADNPAFGSADAQQMQQGMSVFMRGMTAISAACTTFVICAYLGVVAGVFLKAPKPPTSA